jgi:hypothetical protein
MIKNKVKILHRRKRLKVKVLVEVSVILLMGVRQVNSTHS